MTRREDLQADLTVIGGGPGGYTAAVRGAQLGGEIVLVEEKKLGGVCINIGCIPSKTLLHSTTLLNQIHNADLFGVKVNKALLDLNRLFTRKNSVVDEMRQRIEQLLKRNGVHVMHGRGRLAAPKSVNIDGPEGEFRVESRAVVIATGSRPAAPPIRGLEHMVTTERLVEMCELPGEVVIIGGGPEGVEFSTMLSDMGVKVTVVEVMDTLLPLEDEEIGGRIEEVLRRKGVKVKVGTTVLGISGDDWGKTVFIKSEEGEDRLRVDMVVVAMGRRPNTENLGLEDLSVATRDGWIVVDEYMATSVKGVYAVGDVVGGGFAHVASAQGVVAAENALGGSSTYDGRVVPKCIYTRPQIAAVGLTEKAAKERGFKVKIGRASLKVNAKATMLGEVEGFAKMLIDSSTGRILGVHMMGECVSEVVSEAALAMRLDATVRDIVDTIHPYPTISEVLRDAALDAEGASILAG